MGEKAPAGKLISTVFAYSNGKDLYSQIWKYGIIRYRGYLRWATMQMVYALSLYLLASEQGVKPLLELYGRYLAG